MFRHARQSYRRVKAIADPHDAHDVVLNQPGRALARSILWWTTAAAFATAPIGLLALQIARIDGVNYVFANVAGLLLSGIISQFLFVVAAVAYVVAFPVLTSSRVPRPPVDRRIRS
jgi:hypothetical protein